MTIKSCTNCNGEGHIVSYEGIRTETKCAECGPSTALPIEREVKPTRREQLTAQQLTVLSEFELPYSMCLGRPLVKDDLNVFAMAAGLDQLRARCVQLEGERDALREMLIPCASLTDSALERFPDGGWYDSDLQDALESLGLVAATPVTEAILENCHPDCLCEDGGVCYKLTPLARRIEKFAARSTAPTSEGVL